MSETIASSASRIATTVIFTRPFRYNYYRLFGSKDLGKAYLDKKKLAFEQNKKGRDTFSYVEASKIVARYTDDAYYPVSEMRKDFAKIFKSFAAHEALEKALFGLSAEISADLVALDIRNAMYHLGSITGDISSDELLGNIFSRFCIGK